MSLDLANRIRNVTAVLGPTNTGKTHLAIERMLGHDTGPLRLPLVECDETERTHVHDVLARHGLLGVTAA